MEPIRIGLVGYGGRGEYVAARMMDSSEVELVAVCDQIPALLEDAREAGVGRTTGEFDDLLDDDSIDAISVNTGIAGHASLSIAALEAGKHVICAKPLAETVAEAREMVETAAAERLVGVVDFQQRFRPDFWTLRRAAEEIDPIHVTMSHQRGMFKRHFLRPGYNYGIMDALSHHIDIANWLVDRTPISVSAEASYSNFSPEEALDVVTLRIDYNDGRHATVIGSMGGTGMDDTYQVVGANGNAAIGDGGDVVVHDLALSDEFDDDVDGADPDEWSIPEYAERNARLGQLAERRTLPAEGPTDERTGGTDPRPLIEAFARRVRDEGGEALPTFEDGYDEARIAKAAVRSHERGETVLLADVGPDI